MSSKMAAVLKHWRESSTLILATSHQRGINVSPRFVSSSPLDVQNKVSGENFEILLLKRSTKSKFMPSKYVFPGGVATNADFSSEWIGVFDLLGKGCRQEIFDFVRRGNSSAPMFSRIREPKFSHIPSEVAFRICAIRETFEECGVLIGREINDGSKFQASVLMNKPSKPVSCGDNQNVCQWRSKVDKDPSEFIRMCQELRIVPDIWSLYEWANWLTPTGDIRFDTAFYVCYCDTKPYVAEDQSETIHFQWVSPFECLSQYKAGGVNLAPPQIYELSRLMRFDNGNELLHHVWEKASYRVQRWFPVVVNCADGGFYILPGDSLYPSEFNPEEPLSISCTETITELNAKYPQKHRAFKDAIYCTVSLPGGRAVPISPEEWQIKNKLGTVTSNL